MTPLATKAGKAVSWFVPNDIESVREASREVRHALATEGVTQEEQNAWELVTMEAATNAIKYARPSQRNLPIEVRVTITEKDIEVQIEDFSSGFDWPDRYKLPDPSSESGRGLYLITALTDTAQYFRDNTSNRLVLRRERSGSVLLSSQNLQAVHIDELEHTLETMTEELAACYESLSAIFRFTAELGHAGNASAFASRWLNQLVSVAGVDWFVFRVAENEGLRLVTALASAPELEFETVTMPENSQREHPIEIHAVLGQQDVWIEADSVLLADDPLRRAGPYSAIVCHPIFLQGNLAGVLTVGRVAGRGAFTAGQVNIVHTFADFLGIQLRNARTLEENLRGRLVTRELEIAANIQRSLLPDRLPMPPGFRLSGYSQSASKVGGDFYDALELKDGTILLVMADVMGKGVPAAMFAAIFRSHLRARPDLASRPGEFMKWLNSVLYHDLDRVEMFVTAQLVHLNWKTRELRLATAGHCPALLAATGTNVLEIVAEGMPLGIDLQAIFDATSVVLPAEARLMMFTDGLVDARDSKDDFFGMDRLKTWLKTSAEMREPVRAAKDRLVREIEQFRGDTPASDDITMLILADQEEAIT